MSDISDENHCSYDCTAHPTTLTPYADISGVGIVVGYVGTAAITMLITAFYYLTAYNPNEAPFRKIDPNTKQFTQDPGFRPNPIDIIILDALRKCKQMITRRPHQPVKTWAPSLSYSPRQEACIQCILAMSDLQILSGIASMLSGYIQLHCGISCYHWNILVYLAWFSSLTHLSCLTFLRNYLYNRPGQRAWRLSLMFLLVGMLVAGLLPTGNFNWESPPPSLSLHNYVICYWRRADDANAEIYTTMIMSVLFLLFGFFSRFIRLFRSLSFKIIQQLKDRISTWLRKYLEQRHQKISTGFGPLSILHRTLYYRPQLVLFLMGRVFADMWTSMIFEILWLFGNFFWGLSRLLYTRSLVTGEENEWTFGQVVPVLLLAAPALTIIEYFYSSRSIRDEESKYIHTISPIQLSSLANDTIHTATEASFNYANDHPNRKYYEDSKWFVVSISFMLLDILGSSIIILNSWREYTAFFIEIVIPFDDYGNDISTTVWQWFRLNFLFLVFFFLLLALLFDDLRVWGQTRRSPWVSKYFARALTWCLFGYAMFADLWPYYDDRFNDHILYIMVTYPSLCVVLSLGSFIQSVILYVHSLGFYKQ